MGKISQLKDKISVQYERCICHCYPLLDFKQGTRKYFGFAFLQNKKFRKTYRICRSFTFIQPVLRIFILSGARGQLQRWKSSFVCSLNTHIHKHRNYDVQASLIIITIHIYCVCCECRCVCLCKYLCTHQSTINKYHQMIHSHDLGALEARPVHPQDKFQSKHDCCNTVPVTLGTKCFKFFAVIYCRV